MSRDVGGRGADPSLSDQGAGRAAVDLSRSTADIAPGWTWWATTCPRWRSSSSICRRRTGTSRSSTTCSKTPSVRDVVVSGGDIANLHISQLEPFVSALLDIPNIRDIRLASKGLIGLPQHYPAGQRARGTGAAGEEGVRARRRPGAAHPRQQRPAGHAAGGPRRPGSCWRSASAMSGTRACCSAA